jgi:hypothetical protein
MISALRCLEIQTAPCSKPTQSPQKLDGFHSRLGSDIFDPNIKGGAALGCKGRS